MRTYAWGVAIAGWGLLLPLLGVTPSPHSALLTIFVLLAIATEWLMVPLPRGGFQSAGLAVATAGLVILGPVHTALAMSVGVVIGNGVLHRRPYLNTVFNSGQYILAALAGGAVFAAVHPAISWRSPTLYLGPADLTFLVAILGGVSAYIVTSSVLVSHMVAWLRGASFLAVFRTNIAWQTVNDLTFATLGLIFALIYLDALPAGAVILTVPLLLLGYILMLTTTREQAHHDLEVIERIGRASITLDLEHLYQTMYEQLSRVMPTDIFSVALYDADRDRLSVEFLVTSGRRGPAQSVEIHSDVRAVLTTGLPKIINLRPREMAGPHALPQLAPQIRPPASLLFVPVLKGEQVIGLISVHSYTFNAYGKRDARLVEAIAAQVASAIENARLFEASRRSVERLTTMRHISHAIAATLEMESVVAAIAAGAKQVLDVDRCAIYLGNEQEGLTAVYAHGLPEDFVQSIKRIAQGPLTPLPLNFREPVVVEDAHTDPRMKALREALYRGDLFGRAPDWGNIHTVLTLPLLHRSELMGLLAFYHDRIRPYGAEDIQLAQAIASQTAVAVKNAMLFTQAQRRAAEMDLLNRVLSTVSGTLDLREVFRRIVEEVSGTFGYSHVSIYRLEGDYLVLQAQVGYPGDIYERIHITKGVMGRVARTGKPVLVADVRKDRDYISADPTVLSEAAVPIVVDNRVLGVLNIEEVVGRRLAEADMGLLQALASQLGVALRNATLYDEAQRSRDELSVLHEAAKTISSSLELESVLNNLVQVTCQAFGYEHGAILLADERSSDLVVEATYGYPTGTRGYRIPAGKGVTGWVQRTGQPEIVPDVRQDSRYIGVSERVASELAAPLISEGRVIGVFNLESTRRAAFSQRDLRILTAVAGYATVAIQNARLFEQTKRLAITDGLTELFNHRYLHEAMERSLERCKRDGQPLAVIMLEIDSFKRYNDTYGHLRGDEVLRTVADLLRKGSRPSDIIARYGGDEFMIVLPNTAKEAASEIAERLRRAVEAYPFLLGGNIVTSVTLSVGVAARPDDGDSIDAIVDAVDRAQYTAKRSGGNKVHVAHVYH